MSDSASETAVSRATSQDLLEQMVRIRRFENRVAELYGEGGVPGFMHVSNGHEGSHAGIGAAKEADDWWCLGGARIHGQGLAAGMTMKEILAEVYGKETGSNNGKGGHMHISNVDINLYGSAATIGQGANPGAGLALAQDMLDTGQAVIVVVGDGGTTRGTFHPALNLASFWDLPVVFVIENNRYAMSFPTEEKLEPRNLSDHAKVHGIPDYSIDGADVEKVYNTVSAALDRARSGDGPTVIEHKVHRLEGHYVGDKEVYRREDIEEVREQYDPLKRYREKLLKDSWLTEEEYARICDEVDAEIEEAVQFAQDSPFPEESEAYENLYKTPLYGQEEE
jgi:pyruvate dehydrogenase E1 component alpha subunit